MKICVFAAVLITTSASAAQAKLRGAQDGPPKQQRRRAEHYATRHDVHDFVTGQSRHAHEEAHYMFEIECQRKPRPQPQPLPPPPPPKPKCPLPPGNFIRARDDPNKCIGISRGKVSLVDCKHDDETMVWDFTNNGFWCKGGGEDTDQGSCMGPQDFPQIKVSGGTQWNKWTYGDERSGPYKIANFMYPDECVVRSGSALKLGSCDSSASDWVFEDPCSSFDERRLDGLDAVFGEQTLGGSEAEPFVCTRFYSGGHALGKFQCMYIPEHACKTDAFERMVNPQWAVLTAQEITSVDVAMFTGSDVLIDRTILRIGGYYGRVVRAWGDDNNSATWCLSNGPKKDGRQRCANFLNFDLRFGEPFSTSFPQSR